jgi:hypothetical protein
LRLVILPGLLCACAFAIACGGPAGNSGGPGGAQKPPAAPAVPDDIAAVARGALGSEGEALAWGDLALNGKQQILVVNRLSVAPGAHGEEIVFTRLTIVENSDGKWTQVLLCDEHLKNGHGYLVGSPTDPVTGWKLTFVKDPAKGLILSLAPMEQGLPAQAKTIRVQWNPKVKRYQALEGGTERFTGEVGSLEIIQRPLR